MLFVRGAQVLCIEADNGDGEDELQDAQGEVGEVPDAEGGAGGGGGFLEARFAECHSCGDGGEVR